MSKILIDLFLKVICNMSHYYVGLPPVIGFYESISKKKTFRRFY